MKTILLLDDATTAAPQHAAKLALAIAAHTGANLLLANLNQANCALPVTESVRSSPGGEELSDSSTDGGLLRELAALHQESNGFRPKISLLPPAELTGQELAKLVFKENITMIVKGMTQEDMSANRELKTMLNLAGCPVLLVPDNFRVKDLERIVYIADLRYCKPAVLRYLASMSIGYHARLSIAHLSASGLPHPSAAFADSIFYEEICPHFPYDWLDYQLIKERDVHTAIDVLIHGLQTDLLVLENHQFHFEEVFGRDDPEHRRPAPCVPLLIFPG